VRSRASNRAEKPSRTSAASHTTTSAGKLPLIASASRSIGNARSAANEITWPVAWTPASVRPAAAIFTGAWKMRESASSSAPATVRSSGWYCRP
jgi:hypothetical protein